MAGLGNVPQPAKLFHHEILNQTLVQASCKYVCSCTLLLSLADEGNQAKIIFFPSLNFRCYLEDLIYNLKQKDHNINISNIFLQIF